MKISSKKITILFITLIMILTTAGLTTSIYAINGVAGISFDFGGIYYDPDGLSTEGNLDLDFGTHSIVSADTQVTYQSLNEILYVVTNENGGLNGYRVTVSMSNFNNGLEGAKLLLFNDQLVTDGLYENPPLSYAPQLSAGGDTVLVMKATSITENVNHLGLGTWGIPMTGYLTVYSNTIRAGHSEALMTWDLIID
ncbi:MAG: WxL domain-containing protein [Oscillospiraceae bacterium]|jgi:hypothetical protein|nr:WxL domain-containing protein [Oscillospiraceae bacterium]